MVEFLVERFIENKNTFSHPVNQGLCLQPFLLSRAFNAVGRMLKRNRAKPTGSAGGCQGVVYFMMHR